MYKRGRPNRIASFQNRLYAIVSAVGLWPNRMAALQVRGRHSGRLRSFPVAVTDYEGDRYLVAMLGDATNWVYNVRAARGQALLRHGRREVIRLEEIDPSARAPILRHYLEIARGARPHFPVDWRAPLVEFERIASGYPVFRIRLDIQPNSEA